MNKNTLSKLFLCLGVLLSVLGFLGWLIGFIVIQNTRVTASLNVPSFAFMIGILLIIASFVAPHLINQTQKNEEYL